MSPRWRYIGQEALIGLRRNLLMTVAVVLSITVSLTLLGAFILLSRQIDRAAGDWAGKIEVSIFLCDGRQCPEITPEQRDSLETALRDDPLVEGVFYESKAEAYQRFRDQFREDEDLVESVSPDALPASFRVKLENPEEFAGIRDRFVAWPGVEDIVDQREVIEQFLKFANVIKFGALAIAAIQLVAALVLIGNTIRVAAFARREQTSIMKLVGASNWYIRLPFVVEGVIAGLVGAAVAWGLLLLAVPPVMSWLRENIEFVAFIGSQEVMLVGPWLLVAGVAISASSSILALWGFLDV